MEYVAIVLVCFFAGYGAASFGMNAAGYFSLSRKLDSLTAEIAANTKADRETLEFLTEMNGEK